MSFPIETQRAVSKAQNGYCKVKNCFALIHSIHHRLWDTKVNRKLYPLFIDSPMNGVGLCFAHHSGPEKEQFKITDGEAKLYEVWLSKKINK